jgi:hypothetical protein
MTLLSLVAVGRIVDPESGLNVVRNVASVIEGKASREAFDVLVTDEIIEEEDAEASSAVVLLSDES